MDKSMFNRDLETYTTEALSLDKEVTSALTPLFKKYIELGFSPREIAYIMARTVMDVELELITVNRAGVGIEFIY